MGNLASTPFRASARAPALPSDAVVIDCDWLEATHPHFEHTRAYETQYESTPSKTERSSWMCNVLRSCRQTLHALVSKPTAPAPVTTWEHIDANEASADVMDDDSFFDEFQQVFTPRSALKKTAPTFIAPANTVVKTLDGWNAAKVVKTKALARNNYNEVDDEDDDDDFEDCLSYTTDATDSLSESECESKCFAFCGGLECESQNCCDIEPQDDGTGTDSIYSDDNDETDGETDDDCLARAERLVRMASSCADFTIYLDDYLCQCGECPQYKLIAYEVQRYGTYANAAEMASLTRILQAFSTYNEVVGYDCDMIPAAEECLQVWGGDEDQAFKSFVTLYDEVPHLCA